MLYKVLSSYITTILIFISLALFAGVATFIENDFGTLSARKAVYDTLWYEALLGAGAINFIFVAYKIRFHIFTPRFLFHIAFIVILVGAGLTRYFGIEGSMYIREGESVSYMSSIIPHLQVRIQQDSSQTFSFPLEIDAWGGGNFKALIPLKDDNVQISLKESVLHKEGLAVSGYFDVEFLYKNERATKRFTFGMGAAQKEVRIELGGSLLDVAYGAKNIALPFSLTLNDFTLTRYPGSRSPSEYASDITLHDPRKNLSENHRIFMNNTLTHDGYKLFQTSYDLDEQGTILSVNKDPGKIPTYIGYGLLFLGLVLNLFDKSSRFSYLLRRLKNSALLLVAITLFGFFTPNANAANDYVSQYLDEHRERTKEIAKHFGELIVQVKGRIEPLNTLNREILYKVSAHSSLLGMSADQILLGMVSHPTLWKGIPLIKIKTQKLQNLVGIKANALASFNDFFDQSGAYKLQKEVEGASALPPSKRGTYENDLIKVDERLNIVLVALQGNFFKFFPLPNDQNKRWLNLRESTFMLEDKEAIVAIGQLLDSVFERRYEKGIEAIKVISEYQRREGSAVIPPQIKLDSELLWNRLQIFPRLIPAYLLLGFFALLAAFGALFSDRFRALWIAKTICLLAFALFLTHTFGLALRTYGSAHAPFSDTYESIVYISWSGMLCALIFFRRSLFALAASILVASVFLFGAHLSHIDPEITTLVPVLKSFWLTLHVSIITASYGFFGVGAFLGFFALILFIANRYVRTELFKPLSHLTDINEVSLILGLTLLAIGNFIGGVWANESWGRYWGWDPKETWSYISILVYCAILHVRFLRVRHYEYLFALLSMWGFGSILMTYFGVNFYLAGLHSYAKGDPLPIPLWMYALTLSLGILSLISFFYRDLSKESNHMCLDS